MKHEDPGRKDGQDRQTLIRSTAMLWTDGQADEQTLVEDGREGGSRW